MKNIHGIYTVADYIDEGPYYPDMSWSEVDASYNGMGPEKWPEFARELLDEWFHIFRDGVIIHDCGFDRGLTESDFFSENIRMKDNFKACVIHTVPWWRFLTRRLLYKIVDLLFEAVSGDTGRNAFWEGKLKL